MTPGDDGESDTGKFAIWLSLVLLGSGVVYRRVSPWPVFFPLHPPRKSVLAEYRAAFHSLVVSIPGLIEKLASKN